MEVFGQVESLDSDRSYQAFAVPSARAFTPASNPRYPSHPRTQLRRHNAKSRPSFALRARTEERPG